MKFLLEKWKNGASGAKGEWRVSSWLAISAHVKEYDIFSHVLLRLFSEPEIPV